MAHLHGYQLSGEPLPPLPSPGSGPLGELALSEAAESELLEPAGRLTILREDRLGAAFAIARRDGRFLVWGRERGSFELLPSELAVRISPGPDPEAWGHQLATVAIPLLLAERGAAALHASGVLAPRGAILFAGASGRGKSTTSMLAAAAGLPPLADDAVVFYPGEGGGWRVFGGGTGLWTTPRAAAVAAGADRTELADERGSRRIHRPPAEPHPGPAPVAAVVVLSERGPALETRSLSPADALPKLVPALLHVGDRPALERSFQALASVLERVPVWEVAMPDRLEAARGAIPALIEGVGGG